VNSDSQNLSLGETASRFLVNLSPEERKMSQQEVYRFVRWYGWERPFAELTAPEIANYAKQLSLSDTDYTKKLELIRAFLVYAKKEGWSKRNLATHLKTKKGKTTPRPAVRHNSPESVSLTREGYDKLKAELAALKKRRPQIIEEMQRAAAYKDFRENAPLAAAREERGHLEGRIEELEEALKSVTIIGEERRNTLKVSVGDNIILGDIASGEELCYTIVGHREANPTRGKISEASPISKAVINHSQGEVVEVVTPAGRCRYQIKQVEH